MLYRAFILLCLTALAGSGAMAAAIAPLLAANAASAEMIAGEKTTCDPAIYRFNRFTDGSEYVYRH